MAYDSLNENPDDIIRHRLEQQAIRTMPTPINRTQPVGAPTGMPSMPSNQTQPAGARTPLDFGAGDATRPDGARPMNDVYNDFMDDPRHAGLSRAGRENAFGGLMAMGRNTGVAGGQNRGAAAPSPQGGDPASSQATPGGAGGADMEWRKTLSYGGGPGTLSGFNTAGYDNDKAANSVKNTFGRIAQRYPNTPEGLRQVVNDPDFKRAFPNARLLEGGVGDKIDFGGVLSDFESGSPVGVVDVGQAFDLANNSGTSWAWMPDGEGDPGMGGDGGGGGNFGMDLRSILAGEDPLDDIMKRISDLNGGRTPDAEQQALMDILRGI